MLTVKNKGIKITRIFKHLSSWKNIKNRFGKVSIKKQGIEDNVIATISEEDIVENVSLEKEYWAVILETNNGIPDVVKAAKNINIDKLIWYNPKTSAPKILDRYILNIKDTPLVNSAKIVTIEKDFKKGFM